MQHSLEVELKLEAHEGDLALLAARLESEGGVHFAKRSLRATYFDTSDLLLRKAGHSLRIRDDGKTRTQTLKLAGATMGALLARPEWERPVEGDRPALDDAPDPLRPFLPDDLDAITPTFMVEVTRRLGTYRSGPDEIEIVIDEGVISYGGRGTAVAEVELELKSGTPAAIFALARSLAEQIPVRLGVLTKAERGYALLDGMAESSAKGDRSWVGPEVTAADAFAAIASACLRQYRLNEDRLLATEEPDALHQARVALRRMRSAFSIFRRVVADNRFDHLRGELRWLAAKLGEARDLDVLIERIGRCDQLNAARDSAYRGVREDLDSARSRILMLDLAEWLAVGAWRTAPADPSAVSEPVSAFAAATLDRLRKRLKKRGHDLRALDDEARHDVRIDAKKLRYAAEFLTGAFAGKKPRRRARRFTRTMQELQAHLGDLNDMATAPLVLGRLGLAASVEPPSDRERLIGAAAKAHAKLMKRKRFWR